MSDRSPEEGRTTGREAEGAPAPGHAARRDEASVVRSNAALAELVSRVVERGVVVTGDVVVSVAGVDLLYVALDVLLSATDRLDGLGEDGDGAEGEPPGEGGAGAGDDG